MIGRGTTAANLEFNLMKSKVDGEQKSRANKQNLLRFNFKAATV